MTLPVPQLDDRDFEDLVAEARAYIGVHAPDWTDLSPSDPGIVLVELFAYLTDSLLYRFNRIPEKLYVEFLRLMGVTLRPPSAAVTTIRFDCEKPVEAPIRIPRGTRVAVARAAAGGEPPIFSTAAPVVIEAGQQAVDVQAHQCELVSAELVGTGTGLPRQVVDLRRPPVVAPTGDNLDLVIGVEAAAGELEERVAAVDHDGKPFRVWEEVESFAGHGPEDAVYVADRGAGRIVFAPALQRPPAEGEAAGAVTTMAAVPAAGREIRAWYRHGGGPDGNVAAGTITVMRDAVAGVRSVTNPSAATGGRAPESLEEALVRGPQELHSTERAVTAQDYEAIARRTSGAVARARAFTKAALWRHAAPGTVEVLLVPHVGDSELGAGRLDAGILHAHETENARAQIQAALDERRPLGTACLVSWAQYKTVRVKVRVVVRREEDPAAVKGRVEERLYRTISPLPTPANPGGWRFGQPLRASHVYDMVLKEPGVRFADAVRLIVERAPDKDVHAVEADASQPRTWYAGAGGSLFRTVNDGEGWEQVASFEGETIERIRSHPERPGFVAMSTGVEGGSRLHVSLDAGESWDVFPLPKPEFDVEDIAWSLKGAQATLLLASDVGLYELVLEPNGNFVQLLVTPEQTRGFYAVAATLDATGTRNVAVAAQDAGGVWLSARGGEAGSFREIGLRGEDLRVLAVQREGPRAFLWAGAAAAGAADPGKGAWRWELRGDQDPPEGWVPFNGGWNGGSCWDLSFRGTEVFAATHHAGVQRLDARRSDAQWATLDVNCGLPLRDPTQFLFSQVDGVAADERSGLVLAGGADGVFASDDGADYEPRSATEFTEVVALPSWWLFVSGQHEVDVAVEGG